jgi:hypothetical protein
LGTIGSEVTEYGAIENFAHVVRILSLTSRTSTR